MTTTSTSTSAATTERLSLDDFLARLHGVHKAGTEWKAHCPAHEDDKASLSVGTSASGLILVHCHAGCPAQTVVAALGLTMRDLMGASSSNGKPRIVATYDYRSAAGQLLFQSVRFQPKNFRQRRPDGNGGWLWNLKGVKRVPYRLPELLAADPTAFVFAPEGEKDCDRLAGLGFVATCNAGGAGKWTAAYSSHLCGRNVVILPDNDSPGRQHAEKVAKSLRGTAASVRILELRGLSDKGDVSDWIDAGGTAGELVRLAEACPEWAPTEPRAAAPDEGHRLTGIIGNGEEVKVTAALLAGDITGRNHFAQDAGGKLYRYADGVYKRKAEGYVKAEVKRLCVDLGAADKWGSRLASEVVEFIRVDSRELWERPPADVVNVKNGLLRIADRKLLPHSPDHLSPVQLPVVYDPEARCPKIQAFVDQVFPKDAHALAWEVPAWLTRPDTSIQKAVLLTGEGANGKSTWLNLVTHFLGKGNTSGVSLHKLESDKFAAARLIGKLANICPDLPSEHLTGTSMFKAITGNDDLPAEYKFKDSFEYTPFCRLVFSANHPPQSSDASHAFFRRWLVIPFDRTFTEGEQIPRDVLDEMLTAPSELSGMLNKCLDAADRLANERAFSEPESVRQAWLDFHATTDPLAVWLDRFTIDDPDALVATQVLRTSYNGHAAQGGRPSYPAKTFTTTILRLRPMVEVKQRTYAGRRQLCYIGLGLTHEDCPAPQKTA